jgi:hypothetical protein
MYLMVFAWPVRLDGINPEIPIQLHVNTVPMEKRLLGGVQLLEQNARPAPWENIRILRQIGAAVTALLELLHVPLRHVRTLLLVYQSVSHALMDYICHQLEPHLVGGHRPLLQ